MRRLRGVGEARAFFQQRTWSLEDTLPDPIARRTREIFGEDLNALQVAERIIADVRARGDEALVEWSSRIDRAPLDFIEVPTAELRRALDRVPAATREALERAAERIRAFHTAALPRSWHDPKRGYGEIVTPVDSVGAYVPSGSAPLISTVLMTAVPARAAKVPEVHLATPAPGNALPDDALLAAAAVAGVNRVFKIGGAQAVAALAFGTATVPRVDLICGPGNIFVTAAKKLVFGQVGIDGIYGPTETLVVADESADPDFCAADLLAQAEHDPMAQPVLVTTSENLADAVDRAVEAQLADMPRRSIASAAVEANGATVLVDSVESAIEVANLMAPEHMCLAVQEPTKYVPLVRHAGGLFLGEYSAEVLGDYVAGPSHVMPTGGTARFASALSVRNFLRITPVVQMDEQAFLEAGATAASLAHVEGLTGHAAAAEVRLRRLVGE